MRQFIARLRGIALLTPVYARHYFLNCIGGGCTLADKLFRTRLRKRFDNARTGAVIDSIIKKVPA